MLAARDALGPDAVLMDDVTCPWSVSEALEHERLLRPARPLHWLEEPVWPPEDAGGLARVRAAGTSVAAGKNCARVHAFADLFAAGSVDVAQPSVAKIGITAARQVIALADASNVCIVPHCAYFGPGCLASLHLAATLAGPPLERLWLTLEASPFADWLDAPGGVAAGLTDPGLGCNPDEATLERYRRAPVGEAKEAA